MSHLAKLALGSAIMLLLVACGSTQQSSEPRKAAWQDVPAAPVRIDADPAAAWTGKELIVTGMRFGPTGNMIGAKNVAAAYNPSTRTWRRLAPAPKMDSYCRRDAVWTGKQMLLWGCGQAAFDPETGSWRMLPKAPTGEGSVAWTGRELIGWGGGCCGDASADGSAYDPAANTWRTLARPPLAPSQGPLRAWTGHRLILVVSGYSPADAKPYPASMARAAAYDPATDTWSRVAAPPPGALRYGGTGAWDGHELLVVGNASATRHDAYAYDPAANSWRRLSRPPRGLVPEQAIWSGSRLIVLGGDEATRAFAYDPERDRWTALPHLPLQGPGQNVATWTGRELIVWNGAGAASYG